MTNRRKFCHITILSISLLIISVVDSFSAWPEFPLSSDCFSSCAQGIQSSPAIARGGANLLVVWDDERISTDKDIFGIRLTPEGTALDLVGFTICAASSWQSSPKIAAGDGIYLVVWQDFRNDTYDIYGARINLDGEVLDTDGFPICTGDWLAESPDVAWDGANFLVVWSDDRDMLSSNIHGARVTPEGTVLEADGFQITSEYFTEIKPSVAYNGINYLVVWEVEGG